MSRPTEWATMQAFRLLPLGCMKGEENLGRREAVAAALDAARLDGVRAGLEAAAARLEGGSFLHAEAPDARFVRQATSAIRILDPATVCAARLGYTVVTLDSEIPDE